MDDKDIVIMDQLTFKFPFSKKYYEQDYFVSHNNLSAFKLIDNWPNWPGKWLIFLEKLVQVRRIFQKY